MGLACLPILRVRLPRARPITGAYAVSFLWDVLRLQWAPVTGRKEFDSLNPHLGTPDGLKELSSDLHEREMYPILDVVLNHMAAPGSNFTFTGFPQLFNDSSSFHAHCFVPEDPNPSNQTAAELCWLGDFKMPLPDLNTRCSTVLGSDPQTGAGLWRGWLAYRHGQAHSQLSTKMFQAGGRFFARRRATFRRHQLCCSVDR